MAKRPTSALDEVKDRKWLKYAAAGLGVVVVIVAVFFLLSNRDPEVSSVPLTESSQEPNQSKEDNTSTEEDTPTPEPSYDVNGNIIDPSGEGELSWGGEPVAEAQTINLETGNPTGEAYSGSTRTIDILIDGWSMKTLEGSELLVRTDADTATVYKPVPLTKDDVQNLLKRSPQAVQQTLLRMSTLDSTLKCTETGCTAGSGAVDFANLLADPKSTPVLGASYEGWGVTSGLWGARIRVPDSANSANVEGENWKGTRLNLSPNDTVDLTLPVEENSAAGWGKGTYLLGAGWGLIFSLDAQWSGENPATFTRNRLSDGFGKNEPGDNNWTRFNLVTGLSDTSQEIYVNDLTLSQLTYLTSPTTGCGSAAICVPGRITPTVTNKKDTSLEVCSASGQKGTIWEIQGDFTLNLPHPTHLPGVWGGKNPTSTSNVIGFDTPVNLADGEVTFKQSTYVLTDGKGHTVAILGSRNDAGEPKLKLDTATLFNGEYGTCTTPTETNIPEVDGGFGEDFQF